MFEVLRSSYLMTYFVRYSFTSPRASPEYKNISHFLLRNVAKGIAITNSFLVIFYLARFRTYRNSNLLRMHLPATFAGVYFAVLGTQAPFVTYLFDRGELSQRHALRDVTVAQTPAEQAHFKNRLTQGEKVVLNEVLTMAYTAEYFKNQPSTN